MTHSSTFFNFDHLATAYGPITDTFTPHIIVSFSGGKDSVATYVATVEQYGDEAVTLVFTDTGDETPDTYTYLRWFNKHIHPVVRLATRSIRQQGRRRTLESVEIDWTHSGRSAWFNERFVTVFDEIRHRHAGNPMVPPFPGGGVRFCTKTLKIRALAKWLRSQYPSKVIRQEVTLAIGLRRAESDGRSATQEHAFDFDNGWRLWYPIADWHISDVWRAHKRHGIKPNPTYNHVSRSNCVGCPFKPPREVAQLVGAYGEDIIEGWVTLEEDTGFTWRHNLSIRDAAQGDSQPQLFDLTCMSGYCDID